MRITDFTLPADEANKLSDIDELVEHGVSRKVAEEVVEKLNEVLGKNFTEFLKTATTGHPNQAQKNFIMTSVVAYLHDWAQERVIMASVAGTIALEALKREA